MYKRATRILQHVDFSGEQNFVDNAGAIVHRIDRDTNPLNEAGAKRPTSDLQSGLRIRSRRHGANAGRKPKEHQTLQRSEVNEHPWFT